MWRVTSVLELNGLSQAPLRSSPAILERGTAVHASCEAVAQGFHAPVAPEYTRYVDGLRLWFDMFVPEVLAVEQRITNLMLRLTGRIDLIVKTPQIGTIIIDIKTGQPAPSHCLQTAGYKMLAHGDARYERHLLDRGIVYLPGDGTFQWVEHRNTQDEYLFASALALTAWRYDRGLMSYVDKFDDGI